jgi:hypothetical protein
VYSSFLNHLHAAPSALLTKEHAVDDVDASQVQDLLGKTIYVEWPYLKEALVRPLASS